MNFFLSIDTYFPNDRSPVVYTCCRWTARADECDTAVTVVLNLLALKDFSLMYSIDFWHMVGRCEYQLLHWAMSDAGGAYDYDCLLLRGLSLLIYESKF